MKMFNRLNNLKNKRFIQDSAILQAGSMFSMGLSLLASIIYARVLGVEGYASYALIFAFVSLTGVFMNVGTNKSTLTIMSEAYAQGEKDKIRDVLTYYIKITLLVSLIAGLIIILVAPFLTTRLYNSYEIGQLARVIIISYIIKVFFGMYIVVLQVVRKIKKLTLVENLNKVFYVVLPAGLVLWGSGLRGLVYGHLLVAVIFAVFSILAYRQLRIGDPLLPGWRRIIYNWPRVRLNYYFKFGFLIAMDKNLGVLYGAVPIFILGIFNLEYVAFLKIAVAYAGLALLLVAPIGRLLIVQLPKSKSYSLEIFKRDFFRSVVGSFLITLIMAVILGVLAFWLIPLVYGSEYKPSIALAYPLLVGSVIISLGTGLSSAFRIFKLVKQSIIINLILLIIGTLILYYFIQYYPIETAIYPIAGWLPVATVVPFIYFLRKMKKLKYE